MKTQYKKNKLILIFLTLFFTPIITPLSYAHVVMPFALQGIFSLFGFTGLTTHGFHSEPGYQVMGQTRFDVEQLYDLALWPKKLNNHQWKNIADILINFRDIEVKHFGDLTLEQRYGPILTAELTTPKGHWFNPKYQKQFKINPDRTVAQFLNEDLSHSALILARMIEYCNTFNNQCPFIEEQ